MTTVSLASGSVQTLFDVLAENQTCGSMPRALADGRRGLTLWPGPGLPPIYNRGHEAAFKTIIRRFTRETSCSRTMG
jgi:hypothetical protein